jgi:hypothetical protein
MNLLFFFFIYSPHLHKCQWSKWICRRVQRILYWWSGHKLCANTVALWQFHTGLLGWTDQGESWIFGYKNVFYLKFNVYYSRMDEFNFLLMPCENWCIFWCLNYLMIFWVKKIWHSNLKQSFFFFVLYSSQYYCSQNLQRHYENFTYQL